jgi:hypothetical protein
MLFGTERALDTTPGVSEPVTLSRGIYPFYSTLPARLTWWEGKMSEAAKYWFNTKTKQVEFGLKSSSLDRVGPFETEKEATNAEDIVRSRAKQWLEDEKLED